MSMDLRAVLITNKENVHAKTRNLYPKIPAEKMTWAPAAGMLTLGQLLRHLCRGEMGTVDVVRSGTWRYFEQRIGPPLKDFLGEATDKEEEISQLEAAHAATIAFLRQVPEEALAREYRNDRFKRVAKGWELFLSIAEHESHHRGQIASYLKLLGDPTPSPYGAY